jgi:purine nucleosidase
MHKVIYDTDPGVDDSMALVFQTRHPDIELIGVTSVFGNATIETTTRNALYLVERFAKPSVVVARGAGKPLRRATPEPIPHIHGHNGLGDIDLPELEDDGRGRLDARLAHRFIIDEIRKHPHEINLVAVGPLTNLALALQEDPEIQHLVKQVIIMGGAFGINGILGNVSPCAEANISADPDAADQVFAAAWKVTAVGLDVTQKAIMTTECTASMCTTRRRSLIWWRPSFIRSGAGRCGWWWKAWRSAKPFRSLQRWVFPRRTGTRSPSRMSAWMWTWRVF